MTASLLKVDAAQINAWVEQFHRDGYLFLKDVLPKELCAELRADLDRMITENPGGDVYRGKDLELVFRAFEHSAANLSLFDLEPIVSLAEALIAPDCHVIHNNSFKTLYGGGISTWHQDDPPHYLVTDGKPPTNVRLPVLFFTANYYLTDVTDIAHGSTEVIPGSHLIGQACPPEIKGTEWESKVTYNLGGAGSVVLFNNQLWHRGGPNTSDRHRYITQVTYARRIVGHKYYPFMNYQMPERIYKDADERRKRLLGFLPHGPYG
ncbi:MAG: phytanoyl-CoA dioxygenase family protein [Verrucomicrobia bacterium]|nr:phytanoyl-CoA dioxygenase family protein [Verrucomicrobiota bacterium]